MKNGLYCLVLALVTGCTSFSNNAPEEALDSSVEAALFYKIEAKLGEGPIWNHQTQKLYWVDIEGKQLHILDPTKKENKSISLPVQIGTVVPIDSTQCVVALVDGAYLLDVNTETTALIAHLDADNLSTRLNDGKCDPAGRLWVGSMHWDTTEPLGGLFKLEGNGNSEQVLDGITVSNGIVWSANQKTMYYIDTPTQKVMAFDFDIATGQISNPRVAIEIPKEMGLPDGMTIDAEGKLWIGLWNGDAIVRYDPETGELIQRIPVPAHNVTACAFGGLNLDSLFITTARLDMSEEELKKYPNAGSIFVTVPGVKGVKSHFFQLSQ